MYGRYFKIRFTWQFEIISRMCLTNPARANCAAKLCDKFYPVSPESLMENQTQRRCRRCGETLPLAEGRSRKGERRLFGD